MPVLNVYLNVSDGMSKSIMNAKKIVVFWMFKLSNITQQN